MLFLSVFFSNLFCFCSAFVLLKIYCECQNVFLNVMYVRIQLAYGFKKNKSNIVMKVTKSFIRFVWISEKKLIWYKVCTQNNPRNNHNYTLRNAI